MKNIYLPLILALCLGTQVAQATEQRVVQAGDVLVVNTSDDIIFTGDESVNGAFDVSYTLDFQTPHNTQADLWTFTVLGLSSDFSSLSISLYEDGNATAIFNQPAVQHVGYWDTYKAETLNPGKYFFHITGSANDVSPIGVIMTVPEPETWAMFMIGAGLIGLRLRNRRQLTSVG